MFELSEYKTLLNQAQGTWEFVRNNEKFELTDIYGTNDRLRSFKYQNQDSVQKV